METIKVIDLLILKATKGIDFKVRDSNSYFKNTYTLLQHLNDEVEIIEDTPKEIYFSKEENNNLMEDICKNNVEKKDNFYDYYKEDKKIEKIKDKYCSQISKVELARKINEIIDNVNGE